MPLTHNQVKAIFDPLVLATIADQPLHYREQRAITFLRLGIDRRAVKNICYLSEAQMRPVEAATAEINLYLGAEVD